MERYLQPISLAATLSMCLFPCPIAAQTETAALVSRDLSGSNSGNGASTRPSISADGRFVAFVSNASNLAAGEDDNNTSDIFVRDTRTGITRLVSVSVTGTAGNGSSHNPVISGDGRFVAFNSFANDLTAATGPSNVSNVFVRDLLAEATTLVSVNTVGTSGNASSFLPILTPDGRFVLFRSSASDLVASDTNSTTDVFVRDRQNGTTTLVSINATGTDSGNSASGNPVISADGRFVAFDSFASNLVVLPDATGLDVFVRDLVAGVTTRIATQAMTPAISRDGRYVVFVSDVALSQVYVRDLELESTTLITTDASGTGSGNGRSFITTDSAETVGISPNGQFVVFFSDANNLTASVDSNNTQDVFVHDLAGHSTILVSVNVAGADSGNGRSFVTAISGDGRCVAFQSDASDLTPIDTNGRQDIFLKDLKAGTTNLLSLNALGTMSANGVSRQPVISEGGCVVAFSSVAEDIVGFDANGREDVFLAGIINVGIDIKPGASPNSINIGSAGSVPVAVLGTEKFDATEVDPSTITLAGASVRLKGQGTTMSSLTDVNKDGWLDLVVHVTTEALQLDSSDTQAVLEGRTYQGLLIRGFDSVRIVPH